MFLRSFRIIMLENTILVFWETFLTCVTIFFFAWFSRFFPLDKSFVPVRTIRQSALLFTNWFMFSRIIALVPPGKLFIVTLWFLDIPFPCIPFHDPFLLFYYFIFIHIWFVWGFIVIKWSITIKCLICIAFIIFHLRFF